VAAPLEDEDMTSVNNAAHAGMVKLMTKHCKKFGCPLPDFENLDEKFIGPEKDARASALFGGVTDLTSVDGEDEKDAEREEREEREEQVHKFCFISLTPLCTGSQNERQEANAV
jgi:hypothetical protein